MGLYKQYFKCMGCGRIMPYPNDPIEIEDEAINRMCQSIADPIEFARAAQKYNKDYSVMRKKLPAIATHNCTQDRCCVAYFAGFQRVQEENEEEKE